MNTKFHSNDRTYDDLKHISIRPVAIFSIMGIVLLVSGCATEGKQYSRIQTFQADDPMLSCDSLKTKITQLESDLSNLDSQVQSSQNSSQVLSALSMLGGYGGYGGYSNSFNSTYASVGSNLTAQDATQTSGVRNSYQQRHDVLIKQFYAKKC